MNSHTIDNCRLVAERLLGEGINIDASLLAELVSPDNPEEAVSEAELVVVEKSLEPIDLAELPSLTADSIVNANLKAEYADIVSDAYFWYLNGVPYIEYSEGEWK